MDLSTQTIELFNEMLFACSVIAGIIVNDPSYNTSSRRVNDSNICPLLSESPEPPLLQSQDHLVFSILKIYFGLHKQDLQGNEHFHSFM